MAGLLINGEYNHLKLKIGGEQDERVENIMNVLAFFDFLAFNPGLGNFSPEQRKPTNQIHNI